MLARDAKVYLAARNEDRAKAAIEDLKQVTGKEAVWLKLDLSSLKSVKAAADEFLEWVHGSNLERAVPDSCFHQERTGITHPIQ